MYKPNSESQYILFIDESGKSKLSDPGYRFLLCGIILNKHLHTALSSYMLSLKEKNGISPLINMHAYDLLENEKLRNGSISKKKIDNFFEHLIHLVLGSEIECLVYEIDKTPFVKRVEREAKTKNVSKKAITNYLTREKNHDILYEILTAKMIIDFGKFLKERDAQGEVVVESRRQDDEAVLRGFILATEDGKYKDNHHYEIYSKNSFDRITTLSFQNKRGLSFGLEIADLFAWAELNTPDIQRPCTNKAKMRRITKRIEKVIHTLSQNKIKRPKQVNLNTKSVIGGYRVSAFINSLKVFKNKGINESGDPVR